VAQEEGSKRIFALQLGLAVEEIQTFLVAKIRTEESGEWREYLKYDGVWVRTTLLSHVASLHACIQHSLNTLGDPNS
jgi:hypothetical protein